MKITKETVEYVANLARLKFNDNEIEKFTSEMGKILTYVEKLNTLDTSNVVPTAHVISMANVFRNDEVLPSYDRDIMLSNAPLHENGCIKVPKVVE